MSEVSDVEEIVKEMEAGSEVRFTDLYRVCEHFFGSPRNKGTSHYIFKTPWPGDPRINIQQDKGRAKPYQVRQVLAAIAKKRDMDAAAAAAKDSGDDNDGDEVKPKAKPPKKK